MRLYFTTKKKFKDSSKESDVTRYLFGDTYCRVKPIAFLINVLPHLSHEIYQCFLPLYNKSYKEIKFSITFKFGEKYGDKSL